MRLIDADKVLKDISKAEEAGAELIFIDKLKDYFTTDVGLVEAVPIEWIKNRRDELEKEYYDLFHAYTDEGVNKQVRLLNGDFRAFRTVLWYWEKENG